MADNPYSATNFLVEIDGIASAGFLACTGSGSESAVIEYREGGDITHARLLPGLTRYGRIVLRRGITRNRDLWDWRQTVVTGQTQRRNGAIVLLADDRTEAMRWTFRNG